jgi:hypothetical protein
VAVSVDDVAVEEDYYTSGGFYKSHITHTGYSTYGPDDAPCTKITAVVTAPEGYEGTRTYTFYIPKAEATSVELNDIGVYRARVSDDDGRQLYTHGSNFANGSEIEFSQDVYQYDVKVDYNQEAVYIEPSAAVSGINVAWTLNGNAYTRSNSINADGLDSIVPLEVGENVVELSFNAPTSSSANATKVYTFYVTRDANCNADFSFSDNIEYIASTAKPTAIQKTLGYEAGETAFDATITANVNTRTITVVQNGETKGSGTGTVTVDALSLFSEAAVTVSDAESSSSYTYTIKPYALATYGPTSVYAVMPAPGQFLNGGWSGWDGVRLSGVIGESTDDNVGGSGGGSLGTFGGYVTYYFEDPILNSANNAYGADFEIKGNAFGGNNEPAGIKVAQDLDGDGEPDKDAQGNEIWYDLAGSRHYEDDTVWDYEATYTNVNPDFMPYKPFDVPYTDNLGNSGTAVRANGFHPQSNFPDGENYTYEGNAANDTYNSTTMTYSGVLLDADKNNARGISIRFGYADTVDTTMNSMINGYSYARVEGNPYMGDTSKFDIDWAVGENGEPVYLESVSFVKIISSSLFDQDATGELSPEIMGFERLDTQSGDTAVGRTPAPDSIVLKASGYDDIVLNGEDLPESGGVLEVDVGARQYLQTVVNGEEDDAMIVNASRTSSGSDEAATIEVTSDATKLVRVTIQRGEMEAYSVLLKLSGTATAVDTALKSLAVERNGGSVDGLTRTTVYGYTLTVPSNYGVLQIVPTVKDGATVTVNGEALNENGYVDVTLNAAGSDTTITIVTTYNDTSETTTLTVTRQASSSTDKETGTATISIEKFTLGQGYIVEPTQVTFNKGDTAADVTKELLGASGYQSNTNSQYGFYLSDIYDPDRGDLDIPAFITDALSAADVDLNTTDIDPAWLGEFDYTYTSGWMITVDNEFIPVSSGSWELEDGDVIRWQFTLYGLGADVGNSSPDSEYGGQDSLIPDTDKDALTLRVAEINGMSNKTSLLKAGSNQEAYDNAVAVLENLESTQDEIDEALDKLNSLSSIGTPASSRPSSTITLTPAVAAKNGTASVSMSTSDLKEAISSAKDNGGTITIAPEVTGTADKVTVSIPKASIASIGSDTSSDLNIQTPVGNIALPNSALDSIASQAGGDAVAVSLNTVDTTALTTAQQAAVGDDPVYDISIISGGTQISGFDGASIAISLPYTLKDGEDASNVTVWYLNDAGELQQMTCTYDSTTGLATFTTTHLSYYVVGYEAWTNPFADVASSDWFYGAVKYVNQNSLMSGTLAAAFEPNVTMTRAMLVTVLYRLEGEPAVTGGSSFTDVQDGQWYTNAVIWADANGVVTGYGGGLFGTNDSVTREQMAVILYNYAQYKDYDVTKTAELLSYTDASFVDSWALPAMQWANAEGLITGMTATTLSPTGSATRAQVATILMRLVENIAK